MIQCNFCKLKKYKKQATKNGNEIIIRDSNFMGGKCIFEVPKGEKLLKYIEGGDEKYPNGDRVYQKHIVSWMKEIGDRCEC